LKIETLCSLLFDTTTDYHANLQTLLRLVNAADTNSLLVAGEVCLTGFDYENMEEMVAFADEATLALQEASYHKIIILTMLERVNGHVYNMAKVFYNGEVVYKRAKARLFRFGEEHKFMQEGIDADFAIIEVANIKLALLICFELRFKELWMKSEGADVIAVPAWWGKLRKEHFKILTQSLALVNECYVVASDSKNETCTQIGTIVSPQGEAIYSGNNACLKATYSKKEISLMRRYMDIGIE